MATLSRSVAAFLALAAIGIPTLTIAFEFEVGRTYACPNGPSIVVKELAGKRLVTLGPGQGSTTEWTAETNGTTTVYFEEGFLSFFQIVVLPGADEYYFATPDGPVKGCRATGLRSDQQ